MAAIRIIKDTAWLTYKQVALKILRLTSLFNADFATGKKAYGMSFGRESFPDLFSSVDDLDREIERKRIAEPTDAHETLADRAKRLAREGKKKLDVERLLQKRKKVLATLGCSIRESDLASTDAIGDEITTARAIAGEASALAKEIEEVSARQPTWMRSKILFAVVAASVILLSLWGVKQTPTISPEKKRQIENAQAADHPKPPAGLGRSLADVRAKLTSENGWRWTSEAMTNGSGGKSFKGTNSTMPWTNIQLLGSEGDLGSVWLYVQVNLERDKRSEITVKLAFMAAMGSYFNRIDNAEFVRWMTEAMNKMATNSGETVVLRRNGLESALSMFGCTDGTLVLLTVEPSTPSDE